MATEVTRVDERSRYELVVDGEVIGFADYREDGPDVILPHTVIEPRHRGQGNGDILVEGVLDDVRRHGRKVIPTCWFVREYIDLHPEHADLLAV